MITRIDTDTAKLRRMGVRLSRSDDWAMNTPRYWWVATDSSGRAVARTWATAFEIERSLGVRREAVAHLVREVRELTQEEESAPIVEPAVLVAAGRMPPTRATAWDNHEIMEARERLYAAQAAYYAAHRSAMEPHITAASGRGGLSYGEEAAISERIDALLVEEVAAMRAATEDYREAVYRAVVAAGLIHDH